MDNPFKTQPNPEEDRAPLMTDALPQRKLAVVDAPVSLPCARFLHLAVQKPGPVPAPSSAPNWEGIAEEIPRRIPRIPSNPMKTPKERSRTLRPPRVIPAWDIAVGKLPQGASATLHVSLKETAARTPVRSVSSVKPGVGIQNVNPVRPVNPALLIVAHVPTSVAMVPAERQRPVIPVLWIAVMRTVETTLVMEERTVRTARGIAVNAKRRSKAPAWANAIKAGLSMGAFVTPCASLLVTVVPMHVLFAMCAPSESAP